MRRGRIRPVLIRAFSDFKAFFIYFDWQLKPPIKVYKKALKSEKARISPSVQITVGFILSFSDSASPTICSAG